MSTSVGDHCVKSVRIRSYSGLHFPALALTTERYSVSLRIFSRSGHHKLYITHDTQDVRQGSEWASDTTSVMYRIWIRTEQNVLLPHFIPLFCFMSKLFSSVQDYKQYRVLLTHCMLLVSFYTPWKQKTKGFLIFSGGIERKQHKMG